MLLERQVKAKLLERHSHVLGLTPAGGRLLQLAREVNASVHHMHSEMGNYRRGQHSVLLLQGKSSAMTHYLPGDIALNSRLASS